MDDKLKVVEQQLIEILPGIFECQGCLTTMSGHIKQCLTGHNFCEDCFSRMSSCGICKEAMAEGRNRAIENILPLITVTCSNERRRCQFTDTVPVVQAHEQTCLFSNRTITLEKLTDSTPPIGSGEDADSEEPQHKYIRAKKISLLHRNFFKLSGHSITFTTSESLYHKKWVFRPYCQLNGFSIDWCVAFHGPETTPGKCRFNLEFIDPQCNRFRLLTDEACVFTEKPPESGQFVNAARFNVLRSICMGDDLYYFFEIYVKPDQNQKPNHYKNLNIS